MTTPAKTTILAAIETALGTISTAAGYKTDVTTVENVIKNWGDVSESERPWIGFCRSPSRERFEPQGPGHLWVVLPIYIGAHVHAATEDLVDAAIVNLQDDIIAAMYLDPTLGEVSVDVRIVDSWDDIGDPDRLIGGGSTGYSGTFDQQWEVTYERTTSST